MDDQTEKIARDIVDAAFKIHKELGPGLLERVYEICFCHELKKRGLTVHRQVNVPMEYDGIKFDSGFRIDMLVENRIICELKASDEKKDLWKAQLLSYLRLSGKKLGFLINFHSPLIKSGIKRVVLER